MNIKDYLHLYLGCNCLLLKYQMDESGNWIEYPSKLDGIMDTGHWIADGWCGHLTENVKPVLRKLSDMTEPEWLESGRGTLAHLKTSHHLFTANELKYLLSKHFDLFGLIEAGLAIDATKLNTEPTVQASVASKAP